MANRMQTRFVTDRQSGVSVSHTLSARFFTQNSSKPRVCQHLTLNDLLRSLQDNWYFFHNTVNTLTNYVKVIQVFETDS